eukprot:447956-Alexandrium_andersonii.AAC.1
MGGGRPRRKPAAALSLVFHLGSLMSFKNLRWAANSTAPSTPWKPGSDKSKICMRRSSWRFAS